MERARVAPPRGSKDRTSSSDSHPDLGGDGKPVRSATASYTVVARRYRPQRFEDVVGQDHVVRALRNAIRLNRIAQAYLFCGTRGVGKTTMARILAKCLNCVTGPTEEPCQVCDICQAITQGQDVDVIEIDGASNNGVEQVRELRQNAALRPSRARFKIYYIDEVHMLSTAAFNALLKTLEEPPPHVKFFFATTEANKIPITVLSRCQRFDLAGITPEVIAKTLGEICTQEGVTAEPESLQVVARRAAGSLRDAQSLLDRLLASGSPQLTVEIVHSLLGTASDERLLAMLETMADHDAAGALRLLEEASNEGVQPAEFLGGVLDFARDALVLALGAGSILLSVTPRQRPRLEAIVARWPVDSILAAMQILAEHRTRLRGSLHGRLLVEMALVRVARLEDLTALDTLVERLSALESGAPAVRRPEGGSAKKKSRVSEVGVAPAELASPPMTQAAAPASKMPPAGAGSASPSGQDGPPDPATDPETAVPASLTHRSPQPASLSDSPSEPPPEELPPLELENVRKIWPELLAKLPHSTMWRLSQVEPIAVVGPDILVIAAKPGYNADGADPGSPETLENLGHKLQRLVHRPVTVRYERSVAAESGMADSRPTESRRSDSLMADPLVQKVVELFEARSVQLDYDEADPTSTT
jgi:DNA polymerase-3 subunit gamma/tau